MKIIILFIIQLILLFFTSKKTTQILFDCLRRLTRRERLIFYLMAILYLPGTLVHEMSHFAAATTLFLRVRDISLWPQISGRTIRLGAVAYERKDFVRGFLVGIAPFFGGLFCFYLIAAWRLFPANNFWLTLLTAYLIFAISSTMFSSRQDLIDFLAMIPLIILFAAGYYILDFDLQPVFDRLPIVSYVIKFIETVNIYVLFSVAINLAAIGVLKITPRLLGR